jgi:phage terminase small subunit
MGKELTNKERIFVLEYLLDLNPERAARAAGFAKSMAHTKAYQWVSNSKTKPHVYAAIQSAMKKREKRVERSAEEVVKALWEMGELDIAEFMVVDSGGAIQAIPLDQIPAEKRKYINKIKGKRTIRESSDGSMSTMVDETEYFIPEKKGVYELLGKHYGIFMADKVQDFDFSKMTDEQLRDLAQGKKPKE